MEIGTGTGTVMESGIKQIQSQNSLHDELKLRNRFIWFWFWLYRGSPIFRWSQCGVEMKNQKMYACIFTNKYVHKYRNKYENIKSK